MISLVIFYLLGFSLEAGAWLTLYTAIGECFYHMNIKTPLWVGYFFQRPEMHRIYHQQGRHYDNFSDLAIWDMIFKTYQNPRNLDSPFGLDGN